MTRKFEGSEILIATHNVGKLEEMRELFSPFGIKVGGAAERGLIEPEETETTFVGNARIKAKAACDATGLPVLADDSGIEIEGLEGAPGVYTADWAETSNGRDFMLAMSRANRELTEKNVPKPWNARFCATLVLLWPDGYEEVVAGHVSGTLCWPVRGTLGHGYDPMFQPDGHEVTFAEMDPALKNSISHRAVAFQKLIDSCFA